LHPKNVTFNVLVIGGDEEGLFGWLSTNYAAKKLKAGTETFGVVDLGGASVENSFLPATTPIEHKHKVNTKQRKYELYSYSFLGFGVDMALSKVLSNLAKGSVNASAPIANPCFLNGYQEVFEVNITNDSGDAIENRTFYGTGDYTTCRKITHDILDVDAECKVKPCSFGGVYQPNITGPFYAISSLFYTASFFNISSDVHDLSSLTEETKKYCVRTWDDVTASYPDVSKEFLRNYCYLGSYELSLMIDGFKFHETGDKIHFAGDIDGHDISWPLGAIIKNGILP